MRARAAGVVRLVGEAVAISWLYLNLRHPASDFSIATPRSPDDHSALPHP